jgi:hypothetical protein
LWMTRHSPLSYRITNGIDPRHQDEPAWDALPLLAIGAPSRCRTLWILVTGQPLAASSPAHKRKASAINVRLARKVQEATPDKLLGYLASILPVEEPDFPVEEPDFQVRFVLERQKWKRECAAILLADADIGRRL